MMWIYLVISILTSTYDMRVPCPNNLNNCSIRHTKEVVDTVKIDTLFFCEKKEAVFSIKWFKRSRFTFDNDTILTTQRRLDSIWRGI